MATEDDVRNDMARWRAAMDRRAAMGRRDYQDAWDIAMACAGIPAGGDQATQEGDGIRKGVKWIKAWNGSKATGGRRLVWYEDEGGEHLYWDLGGTRSLSEWATSRVNKSLDDLARAWGLAHSYLQEAAAGSYGKPDWSWTATASEAEECPGSGKCHGSMDWCDRCGAVRDVCDATRCDVHTHVASTTEHTPPQRVAQKTITPYVAKMVVPRELRCDTCGLKGPAVYDDGDDCLCDGTFRLVAGTSPPRRHLVPIYKDIGGWIREQGDEMVRHEVKTRHSIPLCECGEPMHVVAEVKETANDCQRMVVVQIKCVVTD